MLETRQLLPSLHYDSSVTAFTFSQVNFFTYLHTSFQILSLTTTCNSSKQPMLHRKCMFALISIRGLVVQKIMYLKLVTDLSIKLQQSGGVYQLLQNFLIGVKNLLDVMLLTARGSGPLDSLPGLGQLCPSSACCRCHTGDTSLYHLQLTKFYVQQTYMMREREEVKAKGPFTLHTTDVPISNT